MPKKYNDSTLELIWDMIHNKRKTLRQVAEELDSNSADINLIYNAAYKKYGQRTREKIDNGAKSILVKNPAKEIKAFKRPPAEYSNRSPYGIARPGITK